MKPDKTTVFDLFYNQKQFAVPLYQRPYVWSMDTQCEVHARNLGGPDSRPALAKVGESNGKVTGVKAGPATNGAESQGGPFNREDSE